jgi:tripartite-type tricarboxylate transporter receptor subunit TctC
MLATPNSAVRPLRLGGAAIAMAAAAMLAQPVKAAEFSGQTVEWIIPFATGGGSDVWARIFAPFWQKHLPGNPSVVVRNVPGGGSTIGANQFAERAEPDGLTILGTSGSTQFPYLLDDPRVEYEYKDWIPVLVSPTGGVAYTSSALGISGPEEVLNLQGQRLVYASQGATSLDLVPLLAFEILGLDVQAVFGFQGRGDGRLAFERGEATLDYQTSSAYLSRVVPMVEEGQAVPLFSWGVVDDDGNLQRDPTFPDIPHFAEVYETVHGAAPSGTAWNAWRAFHTAGFAAQKIIFLPGGTPDDIVQAWHDAARAVISDPEFVAAAKEELGEYVQVTPPGADRLVEIAIDIDPEAKDWVKSWLTERYDVQF